MVVRSKLSLDDLLAKLRNVCEDGCLTITLNTHRSRPDQRKDKLLLKNLAQQAEEKLLQRYNPLFADIIMGRLNAFIASIDHSKNLESLIIFVNQNIAECLRLHLPLVENVFVGFTFGTRELIRNMHLQSAFYILVLSRQQARMIRAKDIIMPKNHVELFHIDNTLTAKNNLQKSMRQGQENLIEEFFARVDAMVSNIVKTKPLPIILATEKRNFDYYVKISKNGGLIKEHLTKNWDHEKNKNIIVEAWKRLSPILKMENNSRIEELKQALDENKYISDLSAIYKFIKIGRGRTLFVQNEYFQSALLFEDEVFPVDSYSNGQRGFFTDDVVGELIEINLDSGGDVVFIQDHDIQDFDNMVLTTRY